MKKVKEWAKKHPNLVTALKYGAAVSVGAIAASAWQMTKLEAGVQSFLANGYMALTTPEMGVKSCSFSEWRTAVREFRKIQ